MTVSNGHVARSMGRGHCHWDEEPSVKRDDILASTRSLIRAHAKPDKILELLGEDDEEEEAEEDS